MYRLLLFLRFAPGSVGVGLALFIVLSIGWCGGRKGRTDAVDDEEDEDEESKLLCLDCGLVMEGGNDR
jgi:hypothetical protein